MTFWPAKAVWAAKVFWAVMAFWPAKAVWASKAFWAVFDAVVARVVWAVWTADAGSQVRGEDINKLQHFKKNCQPCCAVISISCE